MKKIISVMLLSVTIMILSACSNKEYELMRLSEEGIAPYEFSESENYILQSFAMEDTSQMICFKAPEEAIGLNVNVYRLGADGAWNMISGGGISIGEDRKPMEQLEGTFAMQLKENYAMDFIINCGGRASYKTDEIVLDSENVSSTKGFLKEFRNIEINKEIPVALMVYDDGTSMSSYVLEDYFEPEKFEGMELVQVVTLEFIDHMEETL